MPPPTFTIQPGSGDPHAVTVVMRYRFVLEARRGGTAHTVRLRLRRPAGQACWQLQDFTTPLGESLLHVFTRS